MNQQRRPTKHVEAYLTELKDAGSIPATSTIFFPIKKDFLPVREEVLFVLLGKENGVLVMLRITRTCLFLATQFKVNFNCVARQIHVGVWAASRSRHFYRSKISPANNFRLKFLQFSFCDSVDLALK